MVVAAAAAVVEVLFRPLRPVRDHEGRDIEQSTTADEEEEKEEEGELRRVAAAGVEGWNNNPFSIVVSE